MLPEVVCQGSPFQIGVLHGVGARTQIFGSIGFYKEFFEQTARLEWEDVVRAAERWLPYLKQKWPHFIEEMKGISRGSGAAFEDILAINVRTELAYGLYTDGCTAMSYHSLPPTTDLPSATALLAQNWDWKPYQLNNLIHLVIHHSPPNSSEPLSNHSIAMITEAGIIGKIGLNSVGLGVCLNAIPALGVSHDRLPVHLALRAALDVTETSYSAAVPPSQAPPYHVSSSNGPVKSAGPAAEGPDTVAKRAADLLTRVGVASASHILIADAHTAIGLETSNADVVSVMPMREIRKGTVVAHTNHYMMPHHHSVKLGSNVVTDSPARVQRLSDLILGPNNKPKEGEVKIEEIEEWMKDREGFPGSICRDKRSLGGSETLFSIIMDLNQQLGTVRVGKPTRVREIISIYPDRWRT